MIDTTNIQHAHKAIRESTHPIVVRAQNDVFNRKILDYGKFDILLDPYSGERKNTLKKIDAGVNHVLATIAAKQNIAFGFDLKHLRKLPSEKKAEVLAQIATIIEHSRKAGTTLALTGTSDKRVSAHFLMSLGASTQQAHKAILF